MWHYQNILEICLTFPMSPENSEIQYNIITAFSFDFNIETDFFSK